MDFTAEQARAICERRATKEEIMETMISMIKTAAEKKDRYTTVLVTDTTDDLTKQLTDELEKNGFQVEVIDYLFKNVGVKISW